MADELDIGAPVPTPLKGVFLSHYSRSVDRGFRALEKRHNALAADIILQGQLKAYHDETDRWHELKLKVPDAKDLNFPKLALEELQEQHEDVRYDMVLYMAENLMLVNNAGGLPPAMADVDAGGPVLIDKVLGAYYAAREMLEKRFES